MDALEGYRIMFENDFEIYIRVDFSESVCDEGCRFEGRHY